MATLGDIGLSAAINIISALIFLVAFAILRLQPFNDRVYFPKWYLKGLRHSPTHSGAFVTKFVNVDWRAYIRFLNWIPDALKMPEPELIDHAGLDSAVYLRIYLLGLKIFVPITLLAWAILVPVNWTNSTLAKSNFTYSNIDKLSISNVPLGSLRFGDLSFKAFENFDAVDLPLQIVLSIFRSSLDVVVSLWAAGIIGSWCNFLTVLYIGFIAAHTLPVLYERYEDEVDGFVYNALEQLRGHYKKLDSGVLSKIPRGNFRGKKLD